MVTQQFTGITPDRWLDVKQIAHSDLHLTITSDEGSDTEHGVKLDWLYADPTLTATITVPKFGFALGLMGFHTEQDVMDALAAKIAGTA